MTTDESFQIALPAGLHPFVRLVLAEPSVQARLGAEIEADAFVAAAMAVASEHGVTLDRELLASTLRPDPLGLGRFNAAPLECAGWPPEGWLPAQVAHAEGEPRFDWLWFGERRLTGSFFEDDVRRASALPLNWLLRVRTGVAALTAGAAKADSAPLTGLIFHMSRCGSTLLAQMLAAVPGHTVLSEPGPLDELLLWAWRAGLSPDAAAPAVRAMVAALGQRRGTGAQRLFIKTDAWHTLLLPHLHAAFPAVPWVYLFRDPLEVLASHRRMPGIQTVAGIMPEALFGIEDGLSMAAPDYTAQILHAIGRAAIDHRRLGQALFVDYPALVDAVPSAIAAHFRLALEPADRAAMVARAHNDAKAPDLAFTPDSAGKRAESTEQLRQVAANMAATHRQLLTLSENLPE